MTAVLNFSTNLTFAKTTQLCESMWNDILIYVILFPHVL